jgi:hypothetical protein
LVVLVGGRERERKLDFKMGTESRSFASQIIRRVDVARFEVSHSCSGTDWVWNCLIELLIPMSPVRDTRGQIFQEMSCSEKVRH